MFNVGDRIIMVENAPYGFTQHLSTGVVLSCGGLGVEVEFDYLSGEGHRVPAIFNVSAKHCKLLEEIPQEERILRKIKLMESRWISYQERKHSYV